MLPIICPELLTALKNEQTAVRGFVELLQQEQTLLMENSIDQLPLLTEKKSADALRLNELTEIRRQLLAGFVAGSDSAAILIWLEANNKECLSLWHAISDLAEQARVLNHINGELVQMKLRHNQQSLTTLTRAVSQANLYGPNGQTSFSPGSGRSLGNV
ncbi:MAG: flagellar protein FlgN [Proteobacteria bacterium]|nr:flagellar protein FlgN [Pseudomonadota bacterium]